MNFRGLRAGTRIVTERGEVDVETLRIGEAAMAMVAGRLVPVRWIGRRPVDGDTPNVANKTIRVAAEAFEAQMPVRDLWLAARHLVMIDGALIPIGALVNGATIVEASPDRQPWWQIDLVRHDLVLAEGVPVESFRERPDETCAPPVTSGPVLDGVKTRLLARAKDAFGFSITEDRGLLDIADREVCAATVTDEDVASFVIPPRSRDVYAMSRTWVPREADPLSYDERRLGVCVRRLLLDDSCDVRLDGPELDDGWHPPERDGVGPFRWTDGAGRLPAGARTIAMELCGERLDWAHGRPPAYPGRIVRHTQKLLRPP